MKILFILGAYNPRPSANGISVGHVIDALKQEGHEISIICNKNHGCRDYMNENGISIYRVTPRGYIYLKDYAIVLKNKKPGLAKIFQFISNLQEKIVLFVSLLKWPKVCHVSVRRFRKLALELYQKNIFDIVISVYTPIESILAGLALKKEFPRVVFFPYFLDSLSGGAFPKILSREQAIMKCLKVEREIFQYADRIILMKSSKTHHEQYNNEYGRKMVFLDIPMMIHPGGMNKVNLSIKRNCYKLLFVGSIAHKIRNPRVLINTLLCLERTDVVCEFIGNMDCFDLFRPLKEKFGNRLILTGYLDHDKVLKKIYESDILINIGNNISTMVPSKIFEYMSYRKPIISTYEIHNEPSLVYLRKYPAALLLSSSDSPESNAIKVSCFIDNSKHIRMDLMDLDDIFYLNTPKAFVDTLKKVMEEKR